MGEPSATPRQSLSTLDAVAIIVGMVIGAGIFSFPSMVASQVNSGWMYIAVWVAGGVISLIGALCYAELATTYPDAGGDYYFLRRAFGDGPSFLFAWARMSVIQTGSIALQAFIIGDYAARLLTGPATSPTQFQMISSACAAIVVAFLTAMNVAGVREGKWTQKLLTSFEVLGLLLIVGAGVLLLTRGGTALAPAAAAPLANNLGLALVFVLFTFGGWNEAAYLSAEVSGERRSIVRALVFGIGAVTAIYLLVNVAFLFGLGLDGMRNARGTVAADLLERIAGTGGAKLISLIIVIAALSTVNATIFTGARTNYALGRDFSIFRPFGVWNQSRNTPTNALLLQGLIALVLVGIGAWNQKGIRSMVDYTFPVFWFFFLLAGVSLFVLRWKEPRVQRPFKVPLYPLLPLIFCATCAYMLYSSVTYNGKWSLVGLAVLAAGIPLMLMSESRRELPDEQGKFPGEAGGFTPIVPPAAEPMES